MFALTIGATMASAVLVTAQQKSPGTESGTNSSAPAKVTYIGCLSPGSGENAYLLTKGKEKGVKGKDNPRRQLQAGGRREGQAGAACDARSHDHRHIVRGGGARVVRGLGRNASHVHRHGNQDRIAVLRLTPLTSAPVVRDSRGGLTKGATPCSRLRPRQGIFQTRIADWAVIRVQLAGPTRPALRTASNVQTVPASASLVVHPRERLGRRQAVDTWRDHDRVTFCHERAVASPGIRP